MDPQAVSLTELLGAELDLTRRLDAALERERAAIARHDVEALEEVVQDKRRLVQRLSHLAGEREARATAAGYSPDGEGLRRFLAARDTDGRLMALWSQLEAAARTCREKNRINGGLLDLSLQAVRQALELLRGGDATAAVYGPRGDAPVVTAQRTLAKA